MRSLCFVVIASVACHTPAPIAVVTPAPVVPLPTAPLPTSIERLAQVFAPTTAIALGGTVEGLAAPAVTPWGAVGPLAWMSDVGSERDRPDNARYRFSTDGTAWRYLGIDAVPGDHADDHAPGFVLATPEQPYAHPIVDPYTWRPNRLGLTGTLRLVRVRVNGGAGSSAAATWIAANAIEILDGTAAFPPRLDPAAAKARAAFDAVVAAREPAALAAGWGHVRGAFPAGATPATIYEIGAIEIAYLRWDRTRRVATIGFARMVTAQKLSYARATSADRAWFASPPRPKLDAHYGVLFVGETEIEASGAVHDREFAPSLFWRASCWASSCGGDAPSWPAILPHR